MKKFIICNLVGEVVHVFDAMGYMYDPEDNTFMFFNDQDEFVATWLPVPGWRFQALPLPVVHTATAPNQIH